MEAALTYDQMVHESRRGFKGMKYGAFHGMNRPSDSRQGMQFKSLYAVSDTIFLGGWQASGYDEVTQGGLPAERQKMPPLLREGPRTKKHDDPRKGLRL